MLALCEFVDEHIVNILCKRGVETLIEVQLLSDELGDTTHVR